MELGSWMINCKKASNNKYIIFSLTDSSESDCSRCQMFIETQY